MSCANQYLKTFWVRLRCLFLLTHTYWICILVFYDTWYWAVSYLETQTIRWYLDRIFSLSKKNICLCSWRCLALPPNYRTFKWHSPLYFQIHRQQEYQSQIHLDQYIKNSWNTVCFSPLTKWYKQFYYSTGAIVLLMIHA